MKLGITALGLFLVLVAVTIGVGTLAFGEQIAHLLQALHRLAP